jgi:predicted metal-dependent hydrolase
MSLEKPQDYQGLPPALEYTIPEEIFKSEVRSWAKRIGVEPKTITLRPMKRKWASCSSKGNLTFDTELLHQTAEFRRHAIIHELLHLKYPNHGKMFRTLERMYLEQE